MASLVSKTETKAKKLAEEEEEEGEEGETENPVTSHVYLRPAHSSQSLDKEEVLQRIRQRKRANKVQAAFQALVRLSSSSKPNKVSVPHKKWVDDAFAAL